MSADQAFLDKIQDELWKRAKRPNDPRKRFVTKDSQREIWGSGRNLEDFSAIAKLGGKTTKFLENHFLQTLSILVSIGWNEWPRFSEIFLQHFHDGRHDRTDAAIPEYTIEELVG